MPTFVHFLQANSHNKEQYHNMSTQATDTTITYPIMEHFYTLQGEGRYAGCAAYFIRLGGCDVGCVWCDVKESWPIDAHPHMSIAALLKEIAAFPVKIIVITGGEPTMHNLSPLTAALQAAGYRTHIETSGTQVLTGTWDWVTLSPKKFKPTLASNYQFANELKIIVFNKSDFEWAEGHAAQIPATCAQYLQVEWSKAEQLSPQIIEYIKDNPNWQLSLQTHKYLDIP